MASTAGITASLAGRYASALFDLAVEAGIVSQVERDLDALNQAMRESADLAAMVHNPEISRAAQGGAIEGVAQLLGMADLTRRFLAVLAANRRLARLPAMIAAFADIASAQRGEVTAEVVSAHPLSDEQLEQLRQRLTAREGRTVKLAHSLDPDLLGGLVVTIGSTRIDGSIRTRLDSLSQAMARAA